MLAALRGGQDAMPFGVGGPAEPQAWAPDIIGGVGSALANIPKELIDASKESMAHRYGLVSESDSEPWVDPLGPAATRTAMGLMGTGAPAAEAGAAGIFGGKLAKTADIKALIEANAMNKFQKPMTQIRDDTGWFKLPTDHKWKFEIPDNNSKMISHGLDYGADGQFFAGPAQAMFEHPGLYAAYPELKDVMMYNSVYQKPLNGIGRGSYDHYNKILEVGAPELRRAKSVALHEMQHGVQEIEHFSPGGHPSTLAHMKENTPEKLPPHEFKSDPVDLYERLAGEVEARNVQNRMDFTPEHRAQQQPWQTQDTLIQDQLLYDPVHNFVRSLRGYK